MALLAYKAGRHHLLEPALAMYSPHELFFFFIFLSVGYFLNILSNTDSVQALMVDNRPREAE